MAEFGTAVVGKVTEKLFDRISNLLWIRITRLFKWEANVKNLKEEVERLKTEKQRVLQFTGDAERRGNVAGQNVKDWLDRAGEFIEEMEKLGVDEDKAEKKCFSRRCSNPKTHYQISKKVEKHLETVAQLLQEAAGFKIQDSYCPPPQKTSTAPVKGFEEFGSRESALNGIIEALRSVSVDKIGVYGMPGVGKTMLAKEVARQAEEAQLFDVIVMASVTRNPDLKRIQGEIADKLRLNLQGETEVGRGYQLRTYLEKKKRILVILDDIWTRLDLDELGIPFEDKKNEESSIGEERMQCKILFTSRFLNVLSSDMQTHKNFQLDQLQDEEAWELFKKIVGDEIEKPNLLPTAKEIAKKCAGLPLAVEALANALKGKGPREWKDALRELKRPSPENFTGIPAKVYLPIELSFKHLESKQLQQTFLLCSLLGPNASTQHLLNYGMGLGLFHHVNTMEEARNRVQTLVSNLKSSSLLLNGSSELHFDMHDLVRDVAISIASRGRHMLSLIDDHGPVEWSDKEALKGFEWISLRYANLGELPDELDCPQLTLFCLCDKDHSVKIPDKFFEGMQNLRVLNFTKMHFLSIPSSICFLKNLHSLHVNQSVLEDIAVIGKLKSLKILSLSGCDIEELPAEFRQLTQLKLLDLSDCAKLKVIRPHVLASLSRLEELYLGNSFNQWDVGEEDGNERNASLVELKDLQNLVVLDVHVCDIQLIPGELFSERLEGYKIFIGEVWNSWNSSFNSSKILTLELNASISYDHSIRMLLKKTEELHVKELKGVRNLVYDLDAEGFKELKYLYIQNAPEVQYIINSGEWVQFNALPILEVLSLRNLDSLVKICHSRLGETSFSRLRSISVECCTQLKNLFPFPVAKRLLQLEEIRVTRCSNLVEIVEDDGEGATNDIAEANEKFELVQLRSLKLENLPKFIRLCHGNEKTDDSRSNQTPIFHEKIVFPNLEELQLSWININSIWGSQFSCFQSLTKLIIEGCDHLEHLFSFSMAKNLVKLRWLEIKKCKRMRVVIEPENNAEEMEDWISFQNLAVLDMIHLNNLTRFCSANCSVEFTSLKKLWIIDCPKFKSFTTNHSSTNITDGLESLFNEKVTFPVLERMVIFYLENLRVIWHHQPPADSFSKVKSILIGDSNKLLTIFPSEMLRRLCASLEELRVYSCTNLEEIFELGELNIEESHAIVEAQLKELIIIDLPKLKHVWSKDPRGIITFPNLRSVLAQSCQNLQNIFPASVALGLQQLEKLKLIKCGIEEVVASRGDEAVPMFVFSRLSTLSLCALPRIRYFYPGKHVTEWPMLKKFRAYHCKGVNEINGESLEEFPIEVPLFSIEKVIPRLKDLSLTSKDIAMICKRQYQGDLFSKVKGLHLFCHHDDSQVFPIFFLERFCTLDKLEIRCCTFKELFPSVKSIDCLQKLVGRLRIRKLKLNLLSNLKYIWSQGSGSNLLLQDVESLKVLECGNLISLSESKSSFRNLTTLSVVKCEGLKNLFSFATARSLVQLQTMTISFCYLLTEVVIDGGDGSEDSIVFIKLEVLELRYLRSLTSFCSRNSTFEFPLLEQIMVVQCPNFETFCHGVLRTPMLRRIQTEHFGDGRPVVELNKTINQLYEEQVGHTRL